jgi:hypothetical protein
LHKNTAMPYETNRLRLYKVEVEVEIQKVSNFNEFYSSFSEQLPQAISRTSERLSVSQPRYCYSFIRYTDIHRLWGRFALATDFAIADGWAIGNHAINCMLESNCKQPRVFVSSDCSLECDWLRSRNCSQQPQSGISQYWSRWLPEADHCCVR